MFCALFDFKGVNLQSLFLLYRLAIEQKLGLHILVGDSALHHIVDSFDAQPGPS
jgi:hypothetical protein